MGEVIRGVHYAVGLLLGIFGLLVFVIYRLTKLSSLPAPVVNIPAPIVNIEIPPPPPKVETYEIKPFEVLDHAIVSMDGALIGRRHADHPDIKLALKTPGLQVKYPDGHIDPGVQ